MSQPDHSTSDANLDAEVASRAARTGLDLFALGAAFLLPVAFTTTVYAVFWTPKAALTLIVAGVGLPHLVALGVRGDVAARAYLAFLAVAAASTAFAARPLLALFGHYNAGVGLLFFIGCGAAWAIGRSTSPTVRRLVVVAALAGAATNAVVAIAQTQFDLSSYQLGLRFGRPDGFLGNPVFLGALAAAAACCAVLVFAEDRRRSGPVYLALGVLCATALQLSASRLALGAFVVGTVAILARRWTRRVLVAVVVVVAGLGLGELAARNVAAPSGVGRAETEVASGLTPRIEHWNIGISALAERPILGYGPGQFRAATASRRTLEIARTEGPEKLFVDAHNVVIEILVTTGPLGLLALGAFVVLATRRARGAAALFAAVVISLSVLQPLSMSTIPLAMLLLGVAAWPDVDRIRLPERAGSAALGLVALVAASALILGDTSLFDAELGYKQSDIRRAERFLPPWPEPAATAAKLQLFESIIREPDDPEYAAASVAWRKEAADRDPSNPDSWIELGEVQLSLGDEEGAGEAFRRALEANPQSARAALGRGEVAYLTGRHQEAIRWYRYGLLREQDPDNREFFMRRIRRADHADAG